ncbi:hypothetical protein I6M38_11405 [Shewanella algae]|uniref:hypothetical protein n=1 Tax=Shewanella algae TaxID=38313 RepID=UPI001AAD15E2|nr:hypothetical protein [Shewanella algae]MBO2552585.1 hypothetical protein [Shewanella algae]
MKVIVRTLDKDMAHIIGNMYISAYDMLKEKYSLAIDTIDEIIITEDLMATLEKKSFEYGHEKCASTISNEFVESKILMLSNKSEPKKHCIIIDHDAVMTIRAVGTNLLDQAVSIDVHRIHHEFIHVHEENITKLNMNIVLRSIDVAVLFPAYTCNSEYLANRMSSSTANIFDIKSTLENFINLIEHTPKKIYEITSKIKSGHPIDSGTFELINEMMRHMFACIGYALGYIEGLDIDLKEKFPDLYHRFAGNILSHNILLVNDALDNLFKKFQSGELVDYSCYEELTEEVHLIYNRLGIILQEDLSGNVNYYLKN